MLSYFGLGTGTIAGMTAKSGLGRGAQGVSPDFIRLLSPAITMVADIRA
ncbi:hypothetical protein SAMCFNEI73_Ch3244 [Sinorhizobium americanum]|uniref:Uncharacterized protein n=1 Tax=Sinorhizobium americanum TaxID=194963 RepID=A0A1L3LR13_9HYPH|nr:hypothetical protein SAMCCGM7_Ch3122 [Sinorhizobium americanum CCGM7]APG92507.1 hypothetical protein SAMCFNEI73_Ch3244 [Sinorhizobium americanum]